MTEARHHRLLPGEGDLPLGAFVDAVVAAGYRGPLAAEVLSADLREAAPASVAPLMHTALARFATTGVAP